jgi:polysaccharide deacetylase 2 family uncharacterized protein YibQ
MDDLYTKFYNLRRIFRLIFWNNSKRPEDVKGLLDDLRDFCRADSSCIVVGKDGHIDTHATAVAEGRREVYLRIVQTLNLSDETLTKMKDARNDN